MSGDVYDRALPPVDAVALADDAFTRLAASRARVVITSGNHDSARRLGFSSRLVDAAGVHLRTDAGRAARARAARGRARAGRGLRHPLPRARRPQACMGPAEALPPGGSRRGDAARAGRPRSATRRHPLGRDGARVRRRRRAERERAGHRGRRHLGRPARAVRGHRLRRARAPPRPCGADRRRFATAARRSPTRSPRQVTSRVRGSSTSTRTVWQRPGSSRRPSRVRSRASKAPSTTCSPTAASTCTRTAGCRRPSPIPFAPTARWSGCAPAFRTRWRSASRPWWCRGTDTARHLRQVGARDRARLRRPCAWDAGECRRVRAAGDRPRVLLRGPRPRVSVTPW